MAGFDDLRSRLAESEQVADEARRAARTARLLAVASGDEQSAHAAEEAQGRAAAADADRLAALAGFIEFTDPRSNVRRLADGTPILLLPLRLETRFATVTDEETGQQRPELWVRIYPDDGSVNPFELFLIFVELTAPGRGMPRLTIDQSHNIEAKVEAMTLSVVNLQEAYAKALLVDRDELARAQRARDVLGAHEVLLDAYRIDVRPLCAKIRVERGAAEDPIRALREGGYVQRVSAERGSAETVAGGWGR